MDSTSSNYNALATAPPRAENERLRPRRTNSNAASSGQRISRYPETRLPQTSNHSRFITNSARITTCSSLLALDSLALNFDPMATVSGVICVPARVGCLDSLGSTMTLRTMSTWTVLHPAAPHARYASPSGRYRDLRLPQHQCQRPPTGMMARASGPPSAPPYTTPTTDFLILGIATYTVAELGPSLRRPLHRERPFDEHPLSRRPESLVYGWTAAAVSASSARRQRIDDVQHVLPT